MMMIFVIDSDAVMAECVARACGNVSVRQFGNAFLAMDAIDAGVLPDLIFLEVMLVGPDGFTFLNELVSYADTARVPVVIVSVVNFSLVDLQDYGVVGALNKETMTPRDVAKYVQEYASDAEIVGGLRTARTMATAKARAMETAEVQTMETTNGAK